MADQDGYQSTELHQTSPKTATDTSLARGKAQAERRATP